jgi:malate dehydrogenase
MIPLIRFATYNGIPVSELLSQEQMDKVVADTMVGGATLTKLLGTSAWYAPGAACASLVEAVIRDQKRVLPCCVALDGEYGQKDIALGVPVVLGKSGWENIVDYKLNDAEQILFNNSAEAVRNMNGVLSEMKIV